MPRQLALDCQIQRVFREKVLGARRKTNPAICREHAKTARAGLSNPASLSRASRWSGENGGSGDPPGADHNSNEAIIEMTNWRPDFDPENLYFVTTTAVNRAHLFRRDVIKRLIVDSLDCLHLRRLVELYTFVVMPNHVHFIVRCSHENPLKDTLRDFKKHTSDRIVRHYRAEGNQEVLTILRGAVSQPEKQKHKVWEDGYNAKDVFSPGFLRQKLEYIHNNPCQPHWALADSPEAYPWSGARFYILEEPAIIPLDNVASLLV
jgi:putative transposase